MNDDFDSMFDPQTNDTAPIEAVAPEATEEVSLETPEIAEAEPTVETIEALEADDTTTEHDEDQKSGKSVPLPTFLDMRDRMKAAERLAEERQRQFEDYQRSQQVAASIPDPNSDPIGYQAYRFDQVEQQMLNQKIQICGTYAVKNHGAEIVAEAAKWGETRANTDPAFDEAFRQQPDPVQWVIEQHQAAVRLDEMQRDPEAFARRIALEKGWIAAPAETVATNVAPISATRTKAPKVRPTSLSDVPAATGVVTPQSEKESFDAAFNPR